MREKLTQKRVDEFKLTKSGQVRISDTAIVEKGAGLVLLVGKTGKAYHLLFYRAGKPKTRLLGQCSEMTLDTARDKVRAFWRDPEGFAEAVKRDTVKEVADKWFKSECKHHIRKAETESYLDRLIYPEVGEMPFLKFRREAISELLDKVEEEHSPIVADKVLEVISRLCRWYQTRSESYISPVVPGMKRDKRKPDEKRRKRVMIKSNGNGGGIDANELKEIWQLADSFRNYGAILQLGFLLGGRIGKISTMEWGHIIDGVWHVPKAARQKGVCEKMRLPWLALEIINKRPKRGKYVFGAARNPNKPFTGFGMTNAVFDKKLNAAREAKGLPPIEHWTNHDTRRSCRTLMSKLKIDAVVAEIILGHALTGIIANYNIDDFFEPIGDALDKVCEFIARELGIERPRDGIGDNPKVARIRRK
jgi:integrase